MPLVVTESAKRTWNQSEKQPAFTAEFFALQHATFDVRQFEVKSGGGSPPSTPTPWRQYLFCVSTVNSPAAKQTRDVWAGSKEDAREELDKQLPPLGAGDNWVIRDGGCT